MRKISAPCSLRMPRSAWIGGRHRDQLEVLRAPVTFSAVTVGRSPVTIRRRTVATVGRFTSTETVSPTCEVELHRLPVEVVAQPPAVGLDQDVALP